MSYAQVVMFSSPERGANQRLRLLRPYVRPAKAIKAGYR